MYIYRALKNNEKAPKLDVLGVKYNIAFQFGKMTCHQYVFISSCIYWLEYKRPFRCEINEVRIER